MQVAVYNIEGEISGQVELADDVFAVPFNEGVVHQALVRQLANSRHGTASTKTRGEVAGSTRKLYAQKQTGRARRGDIRSPVARHGGIVFGPHPRSYEQAMPVKMRRLALKCVLSAKVREEHIRVVGSLGFEEPKTSQVAAFLSAIKVDSPVLIATAVADTNLVMSARNIPNVKTLPAAQLNVVDLLSYKLLIVTADAVEKIAALWGGRSSSRTAEAV